MAPSARMEQLRAEVRAIVAGGKPEAAMLPFGIDAIDARLAGGGLDDAGVHEAAGATTGYADDAATTLFLAGIAARRAGRTGLVLWVLARGDLFAPGLAQAGLTPDRLLIAEAPRAPDMLAVMEEGLRHGALAAVVGEVGRLGLAETRRLQLAAEEGRTMALLLRRWRKGDPLECGSSAITRWRIGPVASAPLAVPGVGRARWQVELVRQRGGPGFTLVTEACDAQGRLALPAVPADRSDQAAGGPGWREAA